MAEESWDETADFLICGSGGGAFVAALLLKSIGRNPVILEKTDLFGGSTAMSGGLLWIPNHHLQAAAGVEDSAELALAYMDATVGSDAGPAASRDRKLAFIESGPEMAQWLAMQGIEWVRAEGWSDYYDERAGGCARGRALTMPMLDSRTLGPLLDRLRGGRSSLPFPTERTRDISLATRTARGMWEGAKLLFRQWLGKRRGWPILSMGAAIQGRMLLLADRLGVDMRTDHAVVDLIERDGRVAGVEVLAGGRRVRMAARDGILLDAGGFSRSAEMRSEFGPQPSSAEWTNANPGDTGEIIRIARSHGAALDQMDHAWWVPGTVQPPGTPAQLHVTDLSKPHVIVVNRKGRRIMNESQSYMAMGQALYANDVPAFAIMDSRHRKRYPWGLQPPRSTPENWTSSGYMKAGRTIEELADKCEIEREGLVLEIERFNDFCRTGRDLDFQRGDRCYDRWFGDPRCKPNPNLGAIDRPPFYAFEMIPGDVGTSGGVVTDRHARVLREDGSVIGGLYATGNCSASVMGDCYPGPGASIAASFVFGWIAARHVAEIGGRR